MSDVGVVLLWSNGTPQLQTYRLPADGLVLGRSLTGDDKISGRHARVFEFNDRVLIEDLGSRNGTSVEGVRLTSPFRVRPPAFIRCGRTLFLVVDDIAPYEGRTIITRHRLAVGATLHGPSDELDRAILDETSVAIVGPRWVARALARSYLAARNGGAEFDAETIMEPLENVLAVGSPTRTVLLETPGSLSARDLETLRAWLETDVRFVTCVRHEAELDALPPEVLRWLAPQRIRITEPRYDELPTVVHTAVQRANLGVTLHVSAISELLIAARTADEDELLRTFGLQLRQFHADGGTTFRGGNGYDPVARRVGAPRSLRQVHTVPGNLLDGD